jgi:hypothetical protein
MHCAKINAAENRDISSIANAKRMRCSEESVYSVISLMT